MRETVRRLKINRRYESLPCPWCGDLLMLGDDGAVCEACETPHHARCWDKENGCNGNAQCVNRPLQQLPEPLKPPKPSRSLKPGESFCPTCGDVVTGFCFRCSQAATATGEWQGVQQTSQEAKDALKYAIVGLICCGVLLGPIAISKAVNAKREIAMNPGLGGSGIATAAQVLGVIDILLFIVGMMGRLAAQR